MKSDGRWMRADGRWMKKKLLQNLKVIITYLCEIWRRLRRFG
jgi:hypothetical protein